MTARDEVTRMATVTDVAHYFLDIQDEEAGELITNLKLQKLVYYAQGFHLAMFDKPLFPEKIKAWAHGPVVPQLWYEYKDRGSNPLDRPTNFDPSVFSEEQRELLDEVYQEYGQYSAWRLRDMTHHEPPWMVAFSSGEDNPISQASMKDYFKTRLV